LIALVCVAVLGYGARAHAQHVKIEAVSRPLEEIAKTVSTQTGVRVAVDPHIAEWKATIVYEGSLPALIDALCENFRLNVRSASEADNAAGTPKGYLLVLDPSEKQRLEQLAARRRRQAALRMQADRDLMLKCISDILQGADPTSPAEPGASRLSPGAEPVLEFIGSLPADVVRRLASSTPTDGSWLANKKPNAVIPVASLTPVQKDCLRTFLQGRQKQLTAELGDFRSRETDALATVLQSLDQARVGFWILNDGGGQSLHMSIYYPGIEWAPDYPIVGSDSTDVPDPDASASETGAKAPVSAENISPKSRNGQPEPLATLRLDDAAYGPAVLALARACRTSIVADAFCLPSRMSGYWQNQPRRTILDALCRRLNLKSRWHEKVLLLRADGWEDLLPQEPPARVLDSLEEAAKTAVRTSNPFDGLWQIELLAPIAAQITQTQVIGLSRWRPSPPNTSLPVASPLMSQYELYRWLGSLRPEQRKTLVAGGLSVRALSPAQRVGLAALTHGWGVPPPQDLAVLRLMVGDGSRWPSRARLQIAAPGSTSVDEVY